MQILGHEVGFTGFEAQWADSDKLTTLAPALQPLSQRVRAIRLEQALVEFDKAASPSRAAIWYALHHDGEFEHSANDGLFRGEWYLRYIEELRASEGETPVIVQTQASPLELRRLGHAARKSFDELGSRLVAADRLSSDDVTRIVTEGPLPWINRIGRPDNSIGRENAYALAKAAGQEANLCELHALGGMALAIDQHFATE